MPPTAALTLRKAVREDGPFLLAIRNAEDVRARSHNWELISGQTHEEWLTRHLGAADTAIWIIERDGEKVGYIRAKKLEGPHEHGKWLLSMALDSSARGKGYGTWAVTEGCRLLHEEYRAEAIVADVLTDNSAALRLFKKTGFVMTVGVAEHEDLSRLELSLRE